MNKKFKLLVVFFLFCLHLDFPVSAAVFVNEGSVNDNGSPECWPLDVVVLIDESLSVSRPGGNDPEGYRFRATNQILNVLIANRRFQCPQAIHRLGVVAFGDYAQAALEMVPIDISAEITGTERNAWVAPFEDAIWEIQDYDPQSATLPDLAFEKADELLNQMPRLPNPPGYGSRQQVVILMTDGNPEYATSAAWRADYMQELASMLDEATWGQRHIWVVALKAGGGAYLNARAFDDLTVGEVWQNIAATHGGELKDMEYNENALATALDDIISEEFAQPGLKIECGDFFVDPYLESVRFVFSKRLEIAENLIILSKLDDDTGNVTYQWFAGESQMAGPDSKMRIPEGGYRQEDIIEEYFFQFPLPGRWHFQVADVKEEYCLAGVEARQTPSEFGFEIQLVDHVIPEVEESPYYDTEAPKYFVVQVRAPVTNSFEEIPGYPFMLTGEVNLPDDTAQLPDGTMYPPVEFEPYNGGDEGLWRSTQPILAPFEGMYELELVGSLPHYVTFTATQTAELQPYAVFTHTLSFEGRHFGRLSFEITQPTSETIMPCNTVEERELVGKLVPVTVQLLDPMGEAADTSYYLTSDPTQAFVATFLDANGNTLDTGYLAPSGGSASATFEGALLAGETAVVGCGQVAVQVDFAGSVDQERFILPKTTDMVTFNRMRSDGVVVMINAPAAGSEFLLHPDFLSARYADDVQPVGLDFELLDILTETRVEPAEVATGAPESLYTTHLIAPDGTREKLPLTVSGGSFSASGGLTMTQPGTYTFEVVANSQAFKDGFIPADTEPVVVKFRRYDSVWTRPVTFKIVAGASAAIVIFLVGLFVYLRTGAPRGLLKITKMGEPNEVWAGPYALKGGRYPTLTVRGILDTTIFPFCFPIIKKSALEELGIKRIRTTKVRHQEGAQRAVKLEIVGTNNQVIRERTLRVSDYPYDSIDSITTPRGQADIVYE